MLDLAETEDFRYHASRTSVPVWAFTRCYVCITKGKEKPATHRDGMVWDWVEIKDDFLNRNDYHVWEAGTE